MIRVNPRGSSKQWWEDVLQGEYVTWSAVHREMHSSVFVGCPNKEILASNGRCRGKCCAYRLSEGHEHCDDCEQIMCPTVRAMLEKREAK